MEFTSSLSPILDSPVGHKTGAMNTEACFSSKFIFFKNFLKKDLKVKSQIKSYSSVEIRTNQNGITSKKSQVERQKNNDIL